jgi:signal transduction histidine kinase/CheY-like chemotaxis protein
MMIPDIGEQRILICTPLRKDAELAAGALKKSGMQCLICKTLPELLTELENGAGAILTAEEALPPTASLPLADYVACQPPWSDLPILVLTKTGGNSSWIDGAYERLGNLTLLERPVRASTLVSAARSGLRARQRQYEIRLTNRRKDEFLAMLAHELRNPLAPIGAAAELLGLAHSSPDKVKRASEIIARQVVHMTSLIDDLLDVARVTRGMITLDRETLDFRQILSQAAEQVSPLVTSQRHRLALHLPQEPAFVVGDSKRLVQVVTNLLSNAIKYTPKDGYIAARIDMDRDDVTLLVSDDGIGMMPQTVSQVFELFTQAERTSDRSQGGLGLGLALVKSLVMSHGGTVQAASDGLGMGSTFTVRLPRSQRSTHLAGEHLSEPAASKQQQPLRMLVVDDNVDAANTLEMLLSATGHDVSVEYTAASAIACAQKIRPQVCLLDIGLPDMDGNQLAGQLRATPETASSVLIAVTGYGQEKEREKSLMSGFDYHFVKPIDTAKLLALLAQVPHT